MPRPRTPKLDARARSETSHAIIARRFTVLRRLARRQAQSTALPAFWCALAAWTGLTIAASRPARAITAADISAAAAQACAVMSGQAKPNSRTLQYLLMLDEDMADANPVALALFHDVVHECPKAYLSYEQRLRSQNPFAAHPLVKQQTQLSTSGTISAGPTPRPDFPIRCWARAAWHPWTAPCSSSRSQRPSTRRRKDCSRASARGSIVQCVRMSPPTSTSSSPPRPKAETELSNQRWRFVDVLGLQRRWVFSRHGSRQGNAGAKTMT